MSQLENYLMDKAAETSGTVLMPSGASTYLDRDRSPTKTIRKIGEASDLVQSLELGEGVSGEQVQKLPQATLPSQLRVDTTGKEAPAPATTKQAEHWALPSFARYPLDSYAHVKTAAAYFDEQQKFMAPSLRREYCSNLVKRASALGIEVSDEARKYGADGYAPDSEVEVALAGRVGVIKEAEHLVALEDLKGVRFALDPTAFAVALGEFDKLAGIDHLYDQHIFDPYYSVFGEKRAEDEGAILVGNDYISNAELKEFARTDSCKLKDTFGDDFADEFRKDPVAILKSLPIDQKKMVIRLAASTLTDPTTT